MRYFLSEKLVRSCLQARGHYARLQDRVDGCNLLTTVVLVEENYPRVFLEVWGDHQLCFRLIIPANTSENRAILHICTLASGIPVI